MISELTTNALLDLTKTAAAGLFTGDEYPWTVLPKIGEFIVALGKTLPSDLFEERGTNIWVAKSATVAPSVHITGPCIIDEGAEVRHCAFIRGKVLIGKGAVAGNSVELKNAILFDGAQVPHYNYVGDSILGHKAHLGAQALTSNVKSDRRLTSVKHGDTVLETGLKKFGAIVGDFAEVGCSTVLNPATVIGRHTNIYPLSSVRGTVAADRIYKNQDEIVVKR
ncbi:MAG: UDP-N-acetylglucosamine pyrophosphorylase [Eubacteriales bacterium]|nr:UDP-N-acetylglucosamine pyrophosphorylase [Eubacteriales bacterium]